MLFSFVQQASRWAVPLFLLAIPLYGYIRGVKIYETFLEGAKEGFACAVRIIPFLVAIFVAIEVFRVSGALGLLTRILSPVTGIIGMPAEVMPLAVIRPVSGSGAFGVLAEILKTFGPDSFIGRLASTMEGSCDTTFYILTVYFGSVGIKKIRHSLVAGLIADVAGVLAAVVVCRAAFGTGG